MDAEQACAELWGLLCVDAGPQDYAAIVSEVAGLKQDNAILRYVFEWCMQEMPDIAKEGLRRAEEEIK